MKKKIVVILGAGASFDVNNGAAPVLPSNRDYRPPLARELFTSRFWDFQSSYFGAQVFASELGRLAQTASTFDIEEHLTRYASSSNPTILRHFIDIPPYLRDVIYACANRYVPSPTNYLRLITRLFQDQTHDVMFIVLNYDTMLEDALHRFSRTKIGSMDDYISPKSAARVIKIHGSTNWGFPLNPPGSFEKALDSFVPSQIDTSRIVLSNSGDSSMNWKGSEEGHLYPVLSAPLRGKTFVCPESHTEVLQQYLRDCHKYLIIGTSGLDEDLLNELSAARNTGGDSVTYVNLSGPAVLSMRQNFEKTVLAFSAAEFQDRSEGFTEYLDSDAIEHLLGKP